MGVTVSDIEQKEFAYKGQGYDPFDVDQYLDQICDEMIAMQDRIKELEDQLEKARREADAAVNAVQPVQPVVVKAEEATPVAKTSQTLESILLSAQKLADGAVEDARRRAEAIVKEAQDQAGSIIEDAREEKATLEKSVETLRTSTAEFKTKFLSMLEAQKALVESNASLFKE
jgi:cell division initiation protein